MKRPTPYLPGVIISLSLLLASCQSDSYYNAMTTNEQRFDGQEEKNARFMAETYDMALLLGEMAVVAMNQASSRETYLLAKEVHDQFQTFKRDYKVEAAIQRIKLSSSLKKSSDDRLHQLQEVSEANFDSMYLEYTRATFNALDRSLDDFLETGSNERILSLVNKEQSDLEILEKSLRDHSSI